MRLSKDGPDIGALRPSSSKEQINAEMTRRMLQNAVAIEKGLNLEPIVSNQIGTIPEDEAEFELSDTNKTRKEKG